VRVLPLPPVGQSRPSYIYTVLLVFHTRGTSSKRRCGNRVGNGPIPSLVSADSCPRRSKQEGREGSNPIVRRISPSLSTASHEFHVIRRREWVSGSCSVGSPISNCRSIQTQNYPGGTANKSYTGRAERTRICNSIVTVTSRSVRCYVLGDNATQNVTSLLRKQPSTRSFLRCALPVCTIGHSGPNCYIAKSERKCCTLAAVNCHHERCRRLTPYQCR